MSQYCDFRKRKDQDLSEEEIVSDKQALEKTILLKVQREKSEIVDWLYEIDDIGAINNIRASLKTYHFIVFALQKARKYIIRF